MLNPERIKVVARRVAFLMHHQVVLPEAKEMVEELLDPDNVVNANNSEYLLGAYHALSFLLNDLEGKGY